MIEIELKFRIDSLPEGLKDLIPSKSSEGQDLYYDTEDLRLIRNGNFLRLRNQNTVDFKLDVGHDSHFACKETSFGVNDATDANNSFLEILNFVGIETDDHFENFNDLIKKLILIAPIEKERSFYKAGDNISILIDNVHGLGLFMETEMLLDDDSNKESFLDVKENMITLLREKRIIDDKCIPVSVGYVELYLMEHDRPTYEAGKFKI